MDSYIPILAKFNHIFQEKPPNCGTHIQTMNNLIKRKTSLKTLRRPAGWILLRGVLLIFWIFFLAPEALTRAPKARASRGSVGMPARKFANLGSLKCHFLHFDIISELGCIFLQY